LPGALNFLKEWRSLHGNLLKKHKDSHELILQVMSREVRMQAPIYSNAERFSQVSLRFRNLSNLSPLFRQAFLSNWSKRARYCWSLFSDICKRNVGILGGISIFQ